MPRGGQEEVLQDASTAAPRQPGSSVVSQSRLASERVHEGVVLGAARGAAAFGVELGGRVHTECINRVHDLEVVDVHARRPIEDRTIHFIHRSRIGLSTARRSLAPAMGTKGGGKATAILNLT